MLRRSFYSNSVLVMYTIPNTGGCIGSVLDPQLKTMFSVSVYYVPGRALFGSTYSGALYIWLGT